MSEIRILQGFGDLDLTGYAASLTHFQTDRLWVKGNFILTGCTHLYALPNRLKVDRNFVLIGCESLGCLPFGLQVGGNLNLAGCRFLTDLPLDMEVGGDVVLTDSSIGSIPRASKIKGRIHGLKVPA